MKKVEEVAEQLGIDIWGGPDPAVEQIAEVLRRDRAEQREEDCKAMCENCAQGIPLSIIGNHVDGDTIQLCRASAIRARGED